jgi:hypothetical protein
LGEISLFIAAAGFQQPQAQRESHQPKAMRMILDGCQWIVRRSSFSDFAQRPEAQLHVLLIEKVFKPVQHRSTFSRQHRWDFPPTPLGLLPLQQQHFRAEAGTHCRENAARAGSGTLVLHDFVEDDEH